MPSLKLRTFYIILMSLAFILWRMNYYRLNAMRNAELSGEGVCVGEGAGGGGGIIRLFTPFSPQRYVPFIPLLKFSLR